MNKEPIKLHLSFRGNRNYIYAADIAESLLNYIKVCRNIRIEFHNTADYPVKIHEITGAEMPSFKRRNDVYALMTCKDEYDSARYMVALQDLNADPPTRIDYDESSYTLNASIDDNTIFSSIASLGQEPLHAIVALNKLLLNCCIGTNQWFFVKLEFNEWPVVIKSVNLSISSTLGHNIYKTNILNQNKLIGNIYFFKRGE